MIEKKSVYICFENEIEKNKLIYHGIINENISDYSINGNRIMYTFNNEFFELKKSLEDVRVESLTPLENLKRKLNNNEIAYLCIEEKQTVSYINFSNNSIQGHGLSWNKNKAHQKAFYEYLERYSASLKLPNTRIENYNQIKTNAIDPRRFGVYSFEMTKQNNLYEYSDNLVIEWCKSTSLLDGTGYYVPLQLVQYLNSNLLNRYVYESSNGCALGNTMSEATLYALLECIERESFMHFWFDDLECYEITFNSSHKSIIARILYFEELGYKLRFFYIKTKCDIPLIWCLITSVEQKNPIYSITGLSAHINIEYALQNAYEEVLNAYHMLHSYKPEKLSTDIKKVEKSQKLNSLMDHVYYFASYDAKEKINNKINNTKMPFQNLLKRQVRHLSIKEELTYVLKKAKEIYNEILIVDQTASFLKENHLYCVKVLLPDGIPLDFSSKLIRENGNIICKKKITNFNIHPVG